eukprot:scaffold1605_cov141-Cylindrotheca_fusiformis.AAC.29
MGASHTTLASTSAGGDVGPPELEGDILGAYAMDSPLFPASGRMMRTFRLRHKQNSSTVVLKTMWVTSDLEGMVTQQKEELTRIQEALKGQRHIAPFLFWSSGNYRPKPGTSKMVRQINMLRPHLYTTLSDRLASRPFLTHVEKLWISFQILQALDAMHSANVVHGFLTTENIGLSSWNWVVLVDVASYKARTSLPDDDPSEYLYYFDEVYKHGTDTTPRDKRCYLAPERFFTPSRENRQEHLTLPLTPAMDIFSAGCVIMETFLNGERALDLGDLMEYRKNKASPTLQQKLNKIEFSALRAACRHMLHLDPSERLSASAYLERLQASEVVPESFGNVLYPMIERVTHSPPDARLAIAAAHYYSVTWATVGIRDEEGRRFVEKALGSTMTQLDVLDQPDEDDPQIKPEAKTPLEEKKEDMEDLLAETEALLKKIETLHFDEEILSEATLDVLEVAPPKAEAATSMEATADRSEISQSSLLIYLQSIVSTVRHVQRPASKLVALQLMRRVAKFVTDEARLQRIVPVTVSLLQDQDPLVRASAIHVLASTLSIVNSFPPSDSKVFPQYIFKRVPHLMTDPSLVVRLAFARTVASLAETAHRFLDISHAVRLYEAVGGGGARSQANSERPRQTSAVSTNDVFTDDVAKLLDETSDSEESSKTTARSDSGVDRNTTDGLAGAGKTLISSPYNSELAALHETISRWVVHITTDQSEHSSPVKRALLGDMTRLCNFFGLDGVMAFILPQILTFLNDRRDWQLRAALFEHLPSVCHIIGRAATEHFVLPCLETALVDGEEAVISRALKCLAQLLRMGLLFRSIMLGTPSSVSTGSESPGLLKKYGALLVHPSADVRYFAIVTVNAVCESLDYPDGEVFVIPVLRPFLRYRPSPRHLTTREGLESCLHPPWTRERFQEHLAKFLSSNGTSLSPATGWTSISLQIGGDAKTQGNSTKHSPLDDKAGANDDDKIDSQTEHVCSYLEMLARSRTYSAKDGSESVALKAQLANVLEGSLKLAQQIKFPRQDNPGSNTGSIPSWYNTLRETQESQDQLTSETAAIRSVSALGQVYGLSIMDQTSASKSVSVDISADRAAGILQSDESRMVQAACSGEWGAETRLDPALTDTTLLVTKLNALKVPPLPPRLSEDSLSRRKAAVAPQTASKEQSSSASEWKPRIDTVVASSRTSSGFGHSAPIIRLVVSNDQRFFTTGSNDGTCRVWELDKAEKCNGILESSLTYSGHLSEGNASKPRINDLAVLEGCHSVCSGASDGSIHVWRVDMVSSKKQSTVLGTDAKVAGSSRIRQVNHQEGEILSVNHFNTSSASILTFATQKGFIHSWDLRSAAEPFLLKNPHDTGYITSCTVGSDRNWVVTGTSRGFIALWDLRFQQILKLWHHSRSAPINRLGTSIVPAPQSWTGRSSSETLPFLFAAAGPNECAMFDITTGACRECFRTIDYNGRYSTARLDEIPRLDELPLASSARRRAIMSQGYGSGLAATAGSAYPTINAMVGSIGASSHSFLLTGGSDAKIRHWDFSVASKCYVSSGVDHSQPRPSFEKLDYDNSCRLMLCRQPPRQQMSEVESSRVPKKLFQGLKKPDNCHRDSIQDIKVVRSGLLSCSRDCTVKLWR